MKTLLTSLLLVYSFSLFSQSVYSETELKQEIKKHSDRVTVDLLPKLKDLPADFKPNKLEDFQAFLPTDFDIKSFKKDFVSFLEYTSEYNTINDVQVAEVLMNPSFDNGRSGEVPNLPCFLEWNKITKDNIAEVISCNLSKDNPNIESCMTKAIISDVSNYKNFNQCLTQL